MSERLKELQYRTFTQLIDSVRIDFRSFELEGLIEPMELIKIAQKVNYDLGLKINSTKETIIDVEHGRAKLPADFDIMNFALLCYNYHVTGPSIGSGLTKEEHLITNTLTSGSTACEETVINCPIPDPDPWDQACVQSRCNGDVKVEVVQIFKNQTRCYREFEKVYFIPSKQASEFCVNTQFRGCAHTAQIKNGFVYTSVECGKMYMNYQGTMEDDDGNLLVLDHPMINEYYEMALKERILENLYINGEPDIERRLQLVQSKLKEERLRSNGIVNMTGYYELVETLNNNRREKYNKYWMPFDRYFSDGYYPLNSIYVGSRGY